MESFGERLSRLRKKSNLSQEELAELLDVSRQSVSKWENDKAYPEMTRLLYMSDFFQVSLDDLMRGTKEPAEAGRTAGETFRVNDLMKLWNTFVSNLNGRQKRRVLLLYILVVLVLAGVVAGLCYDAGYVAGGILYDLTH